MILAFHSVIKLFITDSIDHKRYFLSYSFSHMSTNWKHILDYLLRMHISPFFSFFLHCIEIIDIIEKHSPNENFIRIHKFCYSNSVAAFFRKITIHLIFFYRFSLAASFFCVRQFLMTDSEFGVTFAKLLPKINHGCTYYKNQPNNKMNE